MGQEVSTKSGTIWIDNDLPIDEHNPCADEIRAANSIVTDEEIARQESEAKEEWQLYYGVAPKW